VREEGNSHSLDQGMGCVWLRCFKPELALQALIEKRLRQPAMLLSDQLTTSIPRAMVRVVVRTNRSRAKSCTAGAFFAVVENPSRTTTRAAGRPGADNNARRRPSRR
jgi:hypothetical protein